MKISYVNNNNILNALWWNRPLQVQNCCGVCFVSMEFNVRRGPSSRKKSILCVEPHDVVLTFKSKLYEMQISFLPF